MEEFAGNLIVEASVEFSTRGYMYWDRDAIIGSDLQFICAMVRLFLVETGLGGPLYSIVAGS